MRREDRAAVWSVASVVAGSGVGAGFRWSGGDTVVLGRKEWQRRREESGRWK